MPIYSFQTEETRSMSYKKFIARKKLPWWWQAK